MSLESRLIGASQLFSPLRPIPTSCICPGVSAAMAFRFSEIPGVWITPDPEALIRANYGEVMSRLSDQIDKWITLPLNLVARVGILKMVVLPKHLYLFINLPIRLGAPFFATLKAQTSRLLWAGRQAALHSVGHSRPTLSGWRLRSP